MTACLQGSLLSCLGIKPVTSCFRAIITCPFQHIMTIQCMKWEIGCEAYYDNMLDFRQLHNHVDIVNIIVLHGCQNCINYFMVCVFLCFGV